MNRRKGQRKRRQTSQTKRKPELGYYYIVADAKKTETNYLHGLRDSIPAVYRGRIVIKVVSAKTQDLINIADSSVAKSPQYRQPWIVFDHDQVKDFDEIIDQAQAREIQVGWSNPCIETWFSCYYGNMITQPDSTSCVREFSKLHILKTGQKYRKNNPDIYRILCQTGDQESAIRRAEDKLLEHKRNYKDNPSEMIPATTLHRLISEILNKTSL